ncbi:MULTISPECIES: hypothetical protein [unclassified Arthrobacter]|uniref:hypothetical protein n=1 Tax=unclassified Arthrobacter TaxID=235627 RepID=UPI002157633A|nr:MULTISPECIES: hypothetical protein [unclassified Arthrobacter]
MGTKGSSTQTSRVIVSIVGLIAIAAYGLTAALQILVWNPLAAVPGATLDEIHDGLARRNESISWVAVLTWTSIGTLLALVVVLLTATRVISRLRTVVILQLLILVLGAPMYFFASFSVGMALADAFFISGGDYTPWGGLLGLVSAAALIGTLMVMIFRGKPGMRTART